MHLHCDKKHSTRTGTNLLKLLIKEDKRLDVLYSSLSPVRIRGPV